METIKDTSYGVMPFIKEGDEWKVFLIHQYGSTGDVFWTFPKGHPEDGESPTETAERELLEETGIKLKHLLPEVSFSQTYTFRYKDHLIDKSVKYFAGFAENTNFSTQEDEVKEAAWLSLSEAEERLTHEPTKEIFRSAILEVCQ